MPYTNLTQTTLNFTELAFGDDGFVSKIMTACVTVVVLWNKGTYGYQNGRGWHGAGGLGAVSFSLLLASVPNNNETLILVIPGTDYKEGLEANVIEAGAWVAAKSEAAHRTIRQEKCYQNVIIKLDGTLVECDMRGEVPGAQKHKCLPCTIL